MINFLKENKVLFIISSFFIIQIFLVLNSFPNHDVAAVFDYGRRMFSSTLYVDIIDINPPLIFWINSFFAIFESINVFLISCIILSAAIIFYIRNLLNTITIFFLCLLIFIAYHGHLGQREYLFLIFSLPLILKIRKEEKINYLDLFIFSIGSLLKPHFAIFYILIMPFLYFKQKENFNKLLWFIPIGLIYMLLVYVIHPEYYHFIIPSALKDYHSYDEQGVIPILKDHRFWPFLITLLIVKTNLERSIIIASALCVTMQAKGWPYHFLMLWTYSFIFIFEQKNYTKYIATALIGLVLSFQNIPNYSKNYQNKEHVEMINYFENAKINALIFSPSLFPFYSAYIHNDEFKNYTPSMSMWILQGVYLKDKIDKGQSYDWLIKAIDENIKKVDTIIIDKYTGIHPDIKFNYENWLNENFDEFSKFEKERTIEYIQIFKRKS